MEVKVCKKGYTLFIIVVNFGIGDKVFEESKKLGILEGTIFLGKGTAQNHILELLGLEEVKKEIVLVVLDEDLEYNLHKTLNEKFHLHKPNHGIAFSLPLAKILGLKSYKNNEKPQGGNKSIMKDKIEYEVIFTIVDRGFAEDVVEAATLAGAKGGTIINARESGTHESSKFFSMSIEPEKEIVMILLEKEKTDTVIANIKKHMEIDNAREGVVFVMDVNQTSGLLK